MFLNHEQLIRHLEALKSLGIKTAFEFKDREELSKNLGDRKDMSLAIYSGNCVRHYEDARTTFNEFLVEDNKKLNEAQSTIRRLKAKIANETRKADLIAIKTREESQALSNNLRPLNQANEEASILEQMCTFAFREALQQSGDAIEIVTKGDYSVEMSRLMNEPKYIDTLIRSNDNAVALKGLVYCIAQVAYEQFSQPALIAKYITSTPWLNDDQKKALGLRALVNSTGMDIDAKIYQCGKWIAENADSPNFIDKFSQGYHPNYFALPTFDFNLECVITEGRTCSGVGLSFEQIERFKQSIESRPLMNGDYGFKKLLGISEAVIKNQLSAKPAEPVLLKTDYSQYPQFMEGDWLTKSLSHQV